MTPFEIDILMHYYTRPGEHAVVSQNPPIWGSTRDWFIENNLLKIGDNSYELTERGQVYIQALCKTPLPVQIWVMPVEEDHVR